MSQTGEKTEKPTDKRIRDARRKGQVWKSQDLTSALLLITAVLVFWLGGKFIGSSLVGLMQKGITNAGSFNGPLSNERSIEFLTEAALDLGWILAPLFLFLFAGAIIFNYIQVRSVFSFETVKPEMNKLNPVEGFKQKFLKPRQYIELIKTILKSLFTFVVVLWVLYAEIPNVVMLATQPLENIVAYTFWLVLRIGFYVAALFLGLAIGDVFLQRYLFMNQMKMTKREVKQEYKESEGDPLIKWMRRNLHKDILAQSSISAVKTADVVVVNPTHLAVALKYDRGEMDAPNVIAKGADLMAKQIREIAKKANVPIMRDVPLARELFEIDLDDEIPEEMYETVAEVLRWVYSLSKETQEV